MKRLKVLRIIARLNIGGPAIHTILLNQDLDKNRFDSLLVAGRTERCEGDMSYLAKEKGVRPIIIPQLNRALIIHNDFIAFWKLFALMIRERPDIIHTHTAKAGALGRLAGGLFNLVSGKRCRLFHTFHGHIFHSYFGGIKSTAFVWIERFLGLFTTKIVAVSQNLRKELIDLRIAQAKKIIVIPLGLELDPYLSLEHNGPGASDCQSVGIIGRLVAVKNHKMFLDVIKKVKDTLGAAQRLKFLIVGDGPLRGELEGYAQGLGISQDVTFTGWVKELDKIYPQLDIVALTSLNEGTPVALIESQAAGRPCVATKVGGINDVVEEGKSGFLVPAQDIEKFAESLIKLLSNPSLRQTMGRHARDRIRHRFNKQRLIKDIETLYLQELSQG